MKAMRLYGRKLPTVCKHPTRLGSQRHCGSGDKTLTYHVTSRDHVL